MQTGNRKCPRQLAMLWQYVPDNIDGDIKTVRHVPRKLSALRSIFIRRGAWFNPVYCQRESLILLRFVTA